MKITREQRVAIHKLWQERIEAHPQGILNPMSYREFRATAQPLLGGDGCIMLLLYGIWYGIETDGYRHT